MGKIGILTLYHVRNIGACFQAYAMGKVLKGMKHEPFFIRGYNNKFAYSLLKGDTGAIRPWTIPFIIKREIKFQKFFKLFDEIGLDDAGGCESIIVGSDSVWISRYGKMLMPTCYFGNCDNKNIIAYAPSTGGRYDLSTYSGNQLDYLAQFKSVGVRDTITQSFYYDVTGENCSLVCDPTLLVDWNNEFLGEYEAPLPQKEYILVYGGFSPELTNRINEYAQSHDLEVINIGIFNRRFKKSIPVGPIEFLFYLRNAKYVITSMFHGVMMSLSLSKEFRYIDMDPNRTMKLKTTLEQLDICNVIVDKKLFDRNYLWEDKIDYSLVNKKIHKMRVEGLKYIKASL